MSPGSRGCLARALPLLVVLILLATMAGTKGESTTETIALSSSSGIIATISSNATTRRSIDGSSSADIEVIADQRTTREQNTTDDGSTARTTSVTGNRSTVRPGINAVTDNVVTESTTISHDKPTTAQQHDSIFLLDTSEQHRPQQEHLIGHLANVTDDLSSTTEITTTTTHNNGRNEIFQRPSTTSTTTRFVESIMPTTTTTTRTINARTSRPVTTSEPGKIHHGAKTRNDLLSGNFHEIKSAQKINTKLMGYFGGKIVKPNVPSALGKYTPYFEDGQEELNATARIGSTVTLDCEIGMLGNKTVTWSHHSPDIIRLLTFGHNAYSVDQRISLSFKYPTNWRLKIQYATPRDSGLYECQVATYPPLVKKIHLSVTAPILAIMDDSGRIKSGERHLKAGSALRLKCEARDVPEQYNETVIWTRGDEILGEDVSENRTTDVMDGREIQVIVSSLLIERATPRHAGNYSCVVPEKAKATVAVHVLNGELPAAVHDGNGVSRSVFNLWLIHLTVSYYVFSR